MRVLEAPKFTGRRCYVASASERCREGTWVGEQPVSRVQLLEYAIPLRRAPAPGGSWGVALARHKPIPSVLDRAPHLVF